MKRIYWKEMLMLSAPVALIALGLVFVRVRSDEPTSSLLSKWPDKTQITKCEVRPATPLEISQGADFGLNLQAVAPAQPFITAGLSYSISEPATKTLVPESPITAGRRESRSELHKAAHPLQQDYHLFKSIDAFNRSVLKSADGVIEVDVKAVSRMSLSTQAEKVFRLNTKSIPLPDVVAARKPNFRITKVELSYFDDTPHLPTYIVQIHINDVVDESQGTLSFPRTVGKWRMEGHPNHKLTAYVNTWGRTSNQDDTVKYVNLSMYFSNNKHPRVEGAKFRGLLSISCGWPQEVTIEFPKSRRTADGFSYRLAKFSTQLAPLPK